MLTFATVYLVCAAIFLEMVYRAPVAPKFWEFDLPASALSQNRWNGANED